jgi:CheY-like chemotaxis protein
MKTAPSSNRKILLVDDCRDGLLVRRLLLEEEGYGVHVAASGEEGMQAFADCAYDVVVTDYRMPRMDGIEMIAQIRKINPHARVILLSGFMEPLGLTTENTGADVVLAKNSMEPANLKRAVKRLVNRPVRKPPVSQPGERARARAKVS